MHILANMETEVTNKFQIVISSMSCLGCHMGEGLRQNMTKCGLRKGAQEHCFVDRHTF